MYKTGREQTCTTAWPERDEEAYVERERERQREREETGLGFMLFLSLSFFRKAKREDENPSHLSEIGSVQRKENFHLLLPLVARILESRVVEFRRSESDSGNRRISVVL